MSSYALTNGRENTFIGSGAGQATTGGGQSCTNCGPGGTPNYFGSHNTFTGYRAGYSNTSGLRNSFFGEAAGYSNTFGTANNFFGPYAGYSNTTGGSNSFFGDRTGYSNTSGTFNSFFGDLAGHSNTTGETNSFFGDVAGYSNTTGDFNSFFGANAGFSNTIGKRNLMLGSGANFRSSAASLTGGGAGDENLFVGSQAGGDSARRNAAAIGAYAFVACDDCMVLGSSAVAAYKVGIGTNTPATKLDTAGTIRSTAQTIPTSGAGLEVIYSGGQGYLTSYDRSGNVYNPLNLDGSALSLNAISGGNVGVGANPPLEKLHVFGNIRMDGCLKDGGGTQIIGNCSSDLRLKRQITPFPNLLDKVARLQPVHFYWRAEEFSNRHFGSEQSYGLIAQEVEEVLPDLVTKDEEGYRAVNYSKLPLVMLQAIKEMKAEQDSLKQQNAALQTRLATLERMMQQLAEQAEKPTLKQQ